MSRRLPAALAALFVVLGACSSAAPVPVAGTASPVASDAATPTPEPAPHPQHEPNGALTALSLQQDIDVWKRWAPSTRPTWTFDTRNPVGEQLAMLVTGERTDDAGIDWLRILLPIRPN